MLLAVGGGTKTDSESSKNGFVERGRVLKLGLEGEGLEGDAVRFLKGLLEPRLTVNRGEGCRSEN